MKLGIDATFLQSSHSGGKEQVLFNLLKGFQTIAYAENVHIFAYDYAEEILKGLIPSAALTLIPYRKSFLKKTVADSLFKTFYLDRLIQENNIDVLLFPHYNTGLKKYKIPTVVIPHDIQTKSQADQFALKDRIIYGLQYYFDFKLRTKIIAISDYDQQEISRYYPAHKEKIEKIYNPIDTDFVLLSGKRKNQKPYIVAVNIAYVHKNTITLIKAFQQIMARIEHDLLLVGRVNTETEFLKTYVNQNKLENRVHFTGFLDDQELHQTLCESDLFVNPSLFEGFGMTAIEASMRCVPVISSMTGASLEVSRNRLHYYQPADDYKILAEKILEVLQNRNSQQELESIKDEFIACYEYKKIAQRYITFLEGLKK